MGEQRKAKAFLVTVLILTLTLATGAAVYFAAKPAGSREVYVGMNIAYGGEETAIHIIDTVSDYVNFVILGSLNLTTDAEALGRVCDYIYQKDLSFIIYVGFSNSNDLVPPRGPDENFFRDATQKYGDSFLGVYLFDEVGGKLIDGAHSVDVSKATTYTEAANTYILHLGYFLSNYSSHYEPPELKLFTSDYTLYWYDYAASYDVVFAEYIGTDSKEIPTGLCRGAATAQQKEWGAMLTWSNYQDFIDTPQQIYEDMVYAYDNGAKYIAVFNSATDHTEAEYGGLTNEHLQAMKNFWEYKKTHQPNPPATTAYVLPRDYGYDFRRPDGYIWGKWPADSLTSQIWNSLNVQLENHGPSLDIVYETLTDNYPVTLPYDRLIYWNGTIVEK
ncbi:MAG: hypothetical protein NWF01_00735 [Candidatus Bathyarchaeota archaeon]|nr:hypothetical protein [Candidatus Bathyarchaeota archaeon]